ncbi:MAG: PqqD family protein [Bryobacteraceae bacterium]
MTAEITDRGGLRKADGLEFHIVDDQCLLYHPDSDRIHYLNPTAGLVFELCDGNHTAGQIAILVQEAYGLPELPLDEVRGCLDRLQKMGIAE